MVLAILGGRKTQTRRAIKLKPGEFLPDPHAMLAIVQVDKPLKIPNFAAMRHVKCPMGKPRDTLYVRENFWQLGHWQARDGMKRLWVPAPDTHRIFQADNERPSSTHVPGCFWRGMPAMFLPKINSRIKLENMGVRVQRLRDITWCDAIAEGIVEFPKTDGTPVYGLPSWSPAELCSDPISAYRKLWESINGKGSWLKNPWVWVITFQLVALRMTFQPQPVLINKALERASA